jgi:hypothetical protein
MMISSLPSQSGLYALQGGRRLVCRVMDRLVEEFAEESAAGTSYVSPIGPVFWIDGSGSYDAGYLTLGIAGQPGLGRRAAGPPINADRIFKGRGTGSPAFRFGRHASALTLPRNP